MFNFPVHNAAFEWTAPMHTWGLEARTQLAVTQRFSRAAYPVLDTALARAVGRFEPFVQLTNLTNTGYEEVLGVRMQGRAFVGGLELQLRRSR